MSSTRRILVIGAGGGMTARFLSSLSNADMGDCLFDLRDIDPAAAMKARDAFTACAAVHGTLDLFNESDLAEAARGAFMVVNGAGPFRLTAAPVRKAAIAAGAHYLDIDDDAESALSALTLEAEAVARGVSLFIGCGASPGVTNVLARDLVGRLDSVEAIDVAWCVGDEGPQLLGRSVLAHTIHMGAGQYAGFHDGRQAARESYAQSRRIPLPGLADHPFYECAHPEPVMFGRSFPELARATCWGSLHPAPLNGVLRGVAQAARQGRISEDDAITYLQNAIAKRKTDKRIDKEAMRGVADQRARGEIAWLQHADFILRELFNIPRPTVSGIGAIARGVLDGRRVELMRHIDPTVARSPLRHMDVSTGCAEAAFFVEALQTGAPPGVLFPEQWIEPEAFYARLNVMLPLGAGGWLGPVICQEDRAGAALASAA